MRTQFFRRQQSRKTIDAIARAHRGKRPVAPSWDVDPGRSHQPDGVHLRGGPGGGRPGGAEQRQRSPAKNRYAFPPGADIPAWGPWMYARSYRWPNVSMAQCVEIAKTFGRLAAEELKGPVFPLRGSRREGIPQNASPGSAGRIRTFWPHALKEEKWTARFRAGGICSRMGRHRHRGALFSHRLQCQYPGDPATRPIASP